ncbi:uncharacterized protein LOC115630951 isoform X2 [Scaptodrosophila lebanonensis]|uniref:Uncharacterized protein LOC115630951 isoform X2 n=1 Tax=Drosophila lebanonensis TaxID=7225 RepID=A0A6J2U4W3_DROLE|nr:uncharacterized protein LOC115630951 isoform X2 [Scaptodrosophila lebanonensis]
MMQDFPPCAIRIWMLKLQNGATLSINAIAGLLHSLPLDESRNAVNIALKAGILVPAAMGKHRRIKVGFCQKLSSLPTSKSDPYCYECHLPDSGSELLIRCSACQRSFHGTCQRRNPQKPNYEVPSNQGQPHRFPLNESDLEDELMGEEIDEGHTLETPAPLIETNNNTYEFDCGVITPFKCEYNDDEVLFVCEKLAPERMRKHVEKIKKEPDLQDSSSLSSGELEQQMCTACRLLELRQLHNPPHMTREELCFLLSASFAVHRSWLDTDVQRYMAKNLKACDIALIKRLLFHNEILGVSKISDNIAAKKYNYLMEFLVDLLDLQHNIGVFFGAQCKEYEATKWLLRDVTHDIREIRSCSDCFRYSIEPNKSPFWFAKPCLQRHELVYAKHGHTSSDQTQQIRREVFWWLPFARIGPCTSYFVHRHGYLALRN